MTIPMFVYKDLSLEKNPQIKICRKGSGSIEKRSYFVSLYFYVSHAMELLDKGRKVLRFLTNAYHHGLQWQ